MTPAPAEDRVDNAALRQAVQTKVKAGELSWSEIARRLGHMRPETCRVRRMLGVQVSRNGCNNPYYNSTVDYDLATEIARAADLDPLEVGL